MTHSDHILAALKRGEALTGLQILQQFGCMNFRDRIWQLRNDGWPIQTTMVKTANNKKVAQYTMKRGAVQTALFT